MNVMNVTEEEMFEMIGKLYVHNQKLFQDNEALAASIEELTSIEQPPQPDAPEPSPSGSDLA